ncbi:MAG: glycosyltransferase family 4 protein [Lachnospiraceae bacterium]|nr:glycosyltransferase family 4 protein [Lachnospiraceae bacterium]
MNNIVFWGTGERCRRLLDKWKLYGEKPDYLCDNNKDNCDGFIYGIPVISPDELYNINNLIIIIACNAADAIKKQIEQMKIKVISVLTGPYFDNIDNLALLYRSKKLFTKEIKKNTCVMDFNYGTTLGGVQTWCYSQAGILRELGISGYYLMPDNYMSDCPNDDFEVKIARVNTITQTDNYVDSYIREILQISPEYVICNFPREIFLAMIIVKKIFLKNMKIIAVMHNDESIYYDTYFKSDEYIDRYIVISTKMKKRLIEKGVKEEKIKMVQWRIGTEDLSNRQYLDENKNLRLGYAGRIVIIQKRIDLVLRVAEKLINDGVKFTLDIVGNGESDDYLLKEISDKNLGDYVNFCGLLKHDEIKNFWMQHDIYLSCSDYEGHSISQYEAMACGVVPVVTDVSGTEDDIVNGYNGYIAPVEDYNMIAQHIKDISNHTELLSIMGKRSVDMIDERNILVDESGLWRDILDGGN